MLDFFFFSFPSPRFSLFFDSYRHDGGVHVVDAGAEVAGVAVLGQRDDHLVARARVLDRKHVGVEAVDCGEDVRKLRVAEVRHDLRRGRGDDGRELERVDGPVEVGGPALLLEREALAEGRLVDLDDAAPRLLEVGDLVAEGQRELVGLRLARDVLARERPVEDGDGPREHALDGLLGERLGVDELLGGHRGGAGDVTWKEVAELGGKKRRVEREFFFFFLDSSVSLLSQPQKKHKNESDKKGRLSPWMIGGRT